jgi:Tol biopolymer transport system component
MDANGANQTRLTNDPSFDLDPIWSPDGLKIAFTTTRNSNAEIYVMNADGSVPTPLTFNIDFDLEPSWSPTGTRIAFTTNRGGNFEIYVMNATGGAQTNLSNHPRWRTSQPGHRMERGSSSVPIASATTRSW